MAQRTLSREGIEVHRFSIAAAIGIPFLAIFIQASFPLRAQWFTIFDLPLLVTIFFAVARRSPILGTITGCVIGLFQDGLTHQPLGIFGIAKTVVGYAASSIGVKVDVENPGSRLIMTFGFYLLHRGIAVAGVPAAIGRPILTGGLLGRGVAGRRGVERAFDRIGVAS